jgi:drug/metabolite transporter (DMT)-like permease
LPSGFPIVYSNMSNSDNHNHPAPVFYAALALTSAALFGAATPASKVLLNSLSAFHLAGLLYLGAVIGVTIESFRNRSWRSPLAMNRTNKGRLLGAVVLGGIIGPVLLLLGLQLASAASVSLWLNLELVATAVLGRILFRDQLGRWGWIGVAGMVFASGLLSVNEGVAGVWAGLLVAAACLCWGFDNHLTALIDGITPTQSTFWKGLVAGSTNLLIGMTLSPLSASTKVIGLALLIGALSYGASIAMYITAAQGIGATRAQVLFASAPFFGLLISVIMLGESISPLQAGSVGVLILSLLLLFRDQHSHRHRHESLAHEHSHRHDDLHHTHTHPGTEPSTRHTHWHEHEPVEHEHPHWPDLHHRHSHRDESSEDSI